MEGTSRAADLLRYFDKWRICLLAFVFAYALLLSINLSYGSMRWDEVTHFTGGLLLSKGELLQWVSTNAFYPPAFDFVTAVFYLLGGASVFAGRLVALTFSALSLVVVYEIANQMYNSRVGLLSALFLAVMPGIIWASRLAMIETMLLFVFSSSMLFFFRWIQSGKNWNLGIAIAWVLLGVAVKYQMLIVAPLIFVVGACFWKRDFIKKEIIQRLNLRIFLAISAVLIMAIVLISYAFSTTTFLTTYSYVLQAGGTSKTFYSARYPTPIFYLIEMTWLNNTIHPISLPLYICGIAGLGLFALRRRFEEKFLLLWFAAVYIVFTLISNREWRYVSIAFPVLAIAASNFFVEIFVKTQKININTKSTQRKMRLKLATILIVVFAVGGIVYSCANAFQWLSEEQLQLPIEQATAFASKNLSLNQTVMVVSPVNRFNGYMVWFYMNRENLAQRLDPVSQYPQSAVDAFTPNFNATELIGECQKNKVAQVLLFEYGATTPFFNSTLNEVMVFGILNESNRFTLEKNFGEEPNRIFVFSFS